ncbi:hypothetical protein FISHEDRAFT_71392 [Fistulina hepatica ATCC 64428]|nr:hypothetical protein FISHEDRAFT_71392 [Fistulina hepatica ATCC 64428]
MTTTTLTCIDMDASPHTPYELPDYSAEQTRTYSKIGLLTESKYLAIDNQPAEAPSKSDIFSQLPEALVDMAVSKLYQANILLVEFKAMLYRRMKVDATVKVFSYIIPDHSLPTASAILLGAGLPLAKADPLLIASDGDFLTKATLHRITTSTEIGPARFIAFFPESFVSFALSDLELAPAYTHEAFTGISVPHTCIYVPRPPAVYACLLRMLLRYPKVSPTRLSVLSDLMQLVMYDLFQLDGFVDEDEDEEDDAADTERALTVVRQWTRANEWRSGEEWMGDALGALVDGSGLYDYLPWKPDR